MWSMRTHSEMVMAPKAKHPHQNFNHSGRGGSLRKHVRRDGLLVSGLFRGGLGLGEGTVIEVVDVGLGHGGGGGVIYLVPFTQTSFKCI